jgi:hypothetical protein
MRRISHKNLSRILSLTFSCLLIGVFAHHANAKVKSAKRSAATCPRPQKSQVKPQDPEEKLQEEKIQEEMEKYLGVRYKRGGISSKGFDCSGFVKQIYSEVFGVDLPHQSSQQNRCSLLAPVSSDALKTGDLVFFATGRSKKGINHVGMYLSDGKFIHSARTKGVVISSLEDAHWKTRLISARRLADRDSIVSGMDSNSVFGLATALSDVSLLTFQVSSAQFESYTPSLTRNELPEVSFNRYYHTELNFVQNLWDDSWSARLTAFRDQFSFPQADPFLAPRPILGGPDALGNSSFTNYAQGLRLASDLQLNEWMRVSPSVTYFNYGPGIDPADQPRLALGLDFHLASSSDGWSLSTGFQYPLSRFASSRLSDISTVDPRMPDMSLTFRQQLSNNLQFSITGERFYRYSYGARGSDSGQEDMTDQQISFAFRFLY